MRIISIREQPEFTEEAIRFLQSAWPEVWPVVYENCVRNCLTAQNPLPQWYLMEIKGEIVGCAGLITNDFISRMDLYPWLCALYVSDDYRGKGFGQLLIEHAISATRNLGFRYLNLCTDHIGYYERFGFEYIGQGYHPWESESRIYQMEMKAIGS